MVYLDNASTTPIDPEVLDAMMPYLKDNYGNPGSIHKLGRDALDAVIKARSQVAELIGSTPDQIIFTSGGSEANNLVFTGLREHLLSSGKTHIITSAIEHDSVLKASERLCEPLQGAFISDTKLLFHKSLLTPLPCGEVRCEDLVSIIEKDTGLVSIMGVNNELGTSNDIREIAKICREHDILFHTDCVQALGFNDIDVKDINCDFLSMSGHKINAPKGIGALFARDKSLLKPMINGGVSQEFGIRGGTENVASIVGFGKACELLRKNIASNRQKAINMKMLFEKTLIDDLKTRNIEDRLRFNAYCDKSKILNMRFEGVDGETLLLLIDALGVCASAGSACRSHEQHPSRVLLAIGLSDNDAHNSLRLSFSHHNTPEDVMCAAQVISRSVEFVVRGV